MEHVTIPPAPGRVVRVSGPLVAATDLPHVAMGELVALGPDELLGEVVALDGPVASIQAYEYTGGLAVGATVTALHRPLSARLGPGLLGGIFDGLLRPLASAETWLGPEQAARSTREWTWQPSVTVGAAVEAGSVIGVVPDAGAVEHRVLVPPDVSGTVSWLAPAGSCSVEDPVAVVADVTIALESTWPVRRSRPVRTRLVAEEPLVTGQRVLDAVFPLALGSSVAVPGGFGTGKTMLLQQIAKWCSADVIVYVGCGERGNEMADVIDELAELTDPRTGRRLSERIVVVANTSNMPMMAREASIYTGATVAEYYRDMGYDAVLIADSTSRWAEALREFGSRSGAMPTEEGYPAILPSALAAFYERAGRVETIGGADASVTIIGAVSPPGGDTTEPVTTHTQRSVRSLWNLDRALAYARHYPAVGWSGSFARDADRIGLWHAAHGDPDWLRRRSRATGILSEADRLTDLAELVGAGTLPGHERVMLLGGRLLREGVLQQNATSANDAHCSTAKTAALMDAVVSVIDLCESLVDGGTTASEIEEADFSPVLRAAAETAPDDAAGVRARTELVLAELGGMR